MCSDLQLPSYIIPGGIFYASTLPVPPVLNHYIICCAGTPNANVERLLVGYRFQLYPPAFSNSINMYHRL